MTTDKPFARIGSDKGAEVVLRAERLPRRGLYLHATDDGIFWVKLAARETVETPPHGWLPPDKSIRFGPYRISAQVAGHIAASLSFPPDLCAKGSLPEPHPTLAIAFGDREVARRRITRRLTLLGRCRPSALRISSNHLSAPHLLLYWEAGTLWAVDLLSRNGTRLDGTPLQAGVFPQGSSLALGEVVVKYAGPTNERATDAVQLPLNTTTDASISEAEHEDGEEPTPVLLPAGTDESVAEGPPSVAEPSLRDQRADLEHERQLLDEERERWLREQAARRAEIEREQAIALVQQKARETEWQERLATLAAGQAALVGQQARLEAGHRELEKERSQVEFTRQQTEAELERRREELDARDAEHQMERGAWDAARKNQEADLHGLASQLDEERSKLAALRQALETERRKWEDLRCQAEQQLADQRQQVEARQVALGQEQRRVQEERQQLEVDRQRSLEAAEAEAQSREQAHESEWRRLAAELAARQVAIAREQAIAHAQQEARETEWRERVEELAAQRAALAEQQARLDAVHQEIEQERSQVELAREQLEAEQQRLQTEQQRVEAERLELEHRQTAAALQQETAAAELARGQTALAEQQARLEIQRRELEEDLKLRQHAFDLQHAEATARQDARGAALEEWAARLTEQQSHLAGENDALQTKRREVEQQQEELEFARQRLDAERAELECARKGPLAESEADRAQLQEERPSQEQSPTAPEAVEDDGAKSDQPSGEDDDARYEETLERLFQYSRARSGWWYRLRCAFSGRSKERRAFEAPDCDDLVEEESKPSP